MQNADGFLKDAKAVDAILDKISISADKAVKSLNNIATELNKISSINLSKTSGGINKLAGSLENLVEKTKGTGITNLSKKLDKFSESLIKIPEQTIKDISGVSKALGTLSKIPSGGLEKLSINLNTFTKSIGMLRGNVSGDIFGTLTSGLGKLTKVISTVDTKKLSTVIKNVETIGNVVSLISPSELTSVSEGLQKFAAALRSFTTGKNIDDLPKQLISINKQIPILVKFITDLANSGDDLDKFEKAAESLGTSLSILATSVRSLANLKLSKLQTNINSIITAFGKFQTLLSTFEIESTRNGFENLSGTLAEFGKAISSFARREKSIDKFASSLKKAIDVLKNIDTSELEDLVNVLDKLAPKLTELGQVVSVFNRNYSRLNTKIKESNKTVNEGISVFDVFSVSLKVVSTTLGFVGNAIGKVTSLAKNLTVSLLSVPVEKLITSFKNLAVAIIKLPFKIVTTSLMTLKKAFIDLPLTVVRKSFNLLTGVISKTFSAINSGINGLISIERNINRVKKAISILLAPFRALISLANSLATALVKLGNTLNIFNRNSKQSANSLNEYSESLNKTATQAQKTSQKIIVVNQEVKQTGTVAKLATTAVGALFATLGARGITLAIKRLVSLQLTMRSLSLLSNVVSNGFRTISNVLSNMTRTAFDAAASFEGIQLSINSAFAREGLESGGFDTLTAAMEGTRETADSLLSRIRTLAIASPFGREALADVFLAARNFGFASNEAEILTRIMSDLGAQANLNSADMREVTRALGQIGSEGKASLENLNQIGDRSIPIFNQLAKNLDVTRAKLREMISAGQVSSTATVEAFLQIGKQAEGQAALATTSLKGLLATFQDFRSDALRNLFQPIFDQLKPLASDLLTEANIDQAISSFSKLGQSIATIVVPAIKSLVTFMNNFRDIVAGIPKPILDNILTFGTFAATVFSVSLAMGALQAILGLTVGVMFTFLNPISLAIGLFTAFATQSEGLKNALNQLGISLFNLVTGVSTVETEMINLQSLFMQLPNPLTLISDALNVLRNDFITVFGDISTFVQTSINSILTFFGTSLTTVSEWGSNIVVAFADGIIATVKLVGDALSAIGDMLAFWLAPGSPPRIAPDIDTWGQLAAEEFLGGFDDADFKAVSDFGSTVESLLSSLDIVDVDTGALVENFSSLIAEINETGTFSQEAFTNLIAGAGSAKTEIADLASDFLTLQIEQEKLNSLTMDYDDALSGVDSQLESIESRQAFEDEQKSIDELNRRLTNTNLSTEERTALERELQKVTAQRSKRELTEQKTVAQNRIKQAQQDIDSTKERIKLAEQFGDANAQAGIAGSLGSTDSATGRVPKIKTPKLKKIKASDILPDIGGSLSKAFSNFEVPEIKTPSFDFQRFGNFRETLSKTTETVQSSFTKIQTNITSTIDKIKQQFSDWGFTIERVRVALVLLGGLIASPLIIGAISSLTPALLALASPLGLITSGVIALGAAFGFLVFNSGGLSGALDTITGAFDRFKNAITLGSTIEGGSVLESLQNIDITSLDSIATGLGLALGNIVEEITDFSFGELNFSESISNFFTFDTTNLMETASTLVSNVSTFIKDNIFTPISTSLTGGTTVDFSITSIFDGVFEFDEESLLGKAQGLVTGITGFFSDNIITPIQNAFLENDSILNAIKDSYIGVYSGLFNAAIEAIGEIDLSESIQNIITKLNESEIGQTIEKEFEGLFGIDLSDSIAEFSTQIQTVIDSLQSISDFFSTTGTTISNTITNIKNGLDSFLALEPVNVFLTNIGEAFTELFNDVSNPEFIAAITELATTLGVLLGGAIGTTVVLIQAVLVPVLRNIGDVIFTVVTFVNNLVDAFLLVATGVTQLISGDITGLTTILEGIGTAAASVVEGITNIGSNLAQLLLDATINVAELIGFDQTQLQERADELFDSFRDTFSVENIKSKIEEFSFQDTIDSLFEFTSPFTDEGSFFDDIADGIDSITDKLSVNINNPLEAFTLALDSISITLGTIADAYDILADTLRETLPSPIGEPLALAAEGLSASFETISNLFKLVKDAFAGELSNPFEGFADSIQPITDFFDTIDESLANLSSSFAGFELPTIPNPFEGIQEGFRNIGDSLGLTDSEAELDVAPTLEIDDSALTAQGEEIAAKINEAYSSAWTERGGITEAIGSVDTTEAVAVAEELGVELGAGVIAGLNAGETQNEAVRTFMSELVTALKTEGQIESPSQLTLTEAGIPLGEGIIEGILQSLSDGSESIRMALQQLFSGLTSSAEGSTLGTFLDVSTQVTAFVEFREQSVSELEKMVKEYLELLEELNKDGLKEITGFVDDSVDKLGEFIEFIEDDVIEAINALLRALEQLKSKGTSEIRSFVNKAEDELKRLRDVFREIGEQAVDQLISALSTLGDRASATIRTQIASISATLGTGPTSVMGQLGFTLGNDLEDGILEGIGSIDITMGNALISEINKALDRVRRETGTFSPSRLFKQRLGEPLGEGVTTGVDEVTKTISDNLTENILDAVGTSTRRLRSSFRRITRDYRRLERNFGRELPNPIPDSIANNAAVTAKSLNEVSGGFTQVVNVLRQDITEPFDNLDTSLVGVNTTIDTLSGSIEGLINELNDLGNALSDVESESGGGEIVVGPITPISSASIDSSAVEEEVRNLGTLVASSIQESIEENLDSDSIGSSVGTVLASANINEALTSSTNELGRSISSRLVDGVVDGLDSSDDSDVTDAVNNIISSAISLADSTADALTDVEEFSENGIQAIEDFVESTIEAFNIFVEFIQSDLIDSIIELAEILEELAERGTTAINTFVTEAEIALRKLITVFSVIGGQAVDALISALTDMASRVVSEINNQLNEIIDELQANSDNPTNAPFFILGDTLGKQLSDGIVAGVEGSAFGITNAIVNEIKKAISDAQVQLGIASPSKLSKTELGIPVGQGVPAGVFETGPQMTKGLVDTISSSLSNAKIPVMNNLSMFEKTISNPLSLNLSPINQSIIPNIESVRQPFTSNILNGLSSSDSNQQRGLSSTQISNMNTSSVSNSAATTNNYNMQISTDNNGAAKVRRNYRRMKMTQKI